ncbi:MAG TPA: hypothetical protein VKR59_06445 [Terriglobales bacterium]|nr:hypothetical protein [Terriglobales bacterium]
MIVRAMPLLQTRRAVPTDFKQSVGELDRMFAPHLLLSFADRLCNRLRQALSRKPRQLPDQLVGIFIFDVHAHVVAFYLLIIAFYHILQSRTQAGP